MDDALKSCLLHILIYSELLKVMVLHAVLSFEPFALSVILISLESRIFFRLGGHGLSLGLGQILIGVFNTKFVMHIKLYRVLRQFTLLYYQLIYLLTRDSKLILTPKLLLLFRINEGLLDFEIKNVRL